MLSTEIAKVAIFELIVLVGIHIGENLQYSVTLEIHLHLVHHVCEVCEGDESSIAFVKGLVGGRHLPELLNNSLN